MIVLSKIQRQLYVALFLPLLHVKPSTKTIRYIIMIAMDYNSTDFLRKLTKWIMITSSTKYSVAKNQYFVARICTNCYFIIDMA